MRVGLDRIERTALPWVLAADGHLSATSGYVAGNGRETSVISSYRNGFWDMDGFRRQRARTRGLALGAGMVLGLSLLAAGIFAQQPALAPNAAPPAAANRQVLETGDVHLAASRVYIHVDKSGLGHEHGVEGRLKSGHIRWDETQGSGELTFDMPSFVADTDGARKYVGLSGTTDPATQQKVTANMLSAEVLNVREFPTARFEIKSIEKLERPSRRGLPQYRLSGDFTLQSVTRPIQVMTEAEHQAGWLHLRGGFTMLQTDFGMTPYSRGFGAIGVADALQIWGDLWIAEQRMAIRPESGSAVGRAVRCRHPGNVKLRVWM